MLLLLSPVHHRDLGNQEVLKGLGGVQVLVEDLNPGFADIGLSADALQTLAEVRLRQGGVRVLTSKQTVNAPRTPILYLKVNCVMRASSPSCYSVGLELRE